jgi:hypothetical protein
LVVLCPTMDAIFKCQLQGKDSAGAGQEEQLTTPRACFGEVSRLLKWH